MLLSRLPSQHRLVSSLGLRLLSTSPSCGSESDGWLSKLLVRKIEPTKESHSRMLSDKEVIYELQTHNVRCGEMDKYIDNYGRYHGEVAERTAAGQLAQELVGSWEVTVGDQDQCIHLWKYNGGYKAVDDARNAHIDDKSLAALVKERGTLLRARHSQYLLAFSFWPAPAPRSGKHLYEIRSYLLKPGTMIEWGNNWARAIHFRREGDEAFAGFFSQVGRLYNVHHLWCYNDLQHRKETRESAWLRPGWDECVAHTVPLIGGMQSRIMWANPFSPTQ
ncbi:protein NipSnap-like isoform X2 [Amphibalanus amphitrite]|uniref:protein NipSnap-like isoform X2 n=1 Tax=Amphibalanus amphitrite TaxID=1232801 RepID=UPI001C8FB61E|nr:protein NipSnap-like isoform X2 [Amphibalanus amphitrite]XP_043207351.1 protein NipSnap-like isoform X2 [Amphibalanus amphitrite]XP_043207352.1 protein NipSnap-like isoform X2 [Amphibalanus amphitrite]XP_043207353.1 protein NipSnap-like isoform X2 [Amphibalanus amphitrite]XP_043207354.1 protein NipSnap-like isoform X2 [Amphibalanus amphitrite]